MKTTLLLAASLLLCATFSGCLTSHVSHSGGMGAVTAENTNPDALIGAAQQVFAESGYSVGPINYPDSIAFDRAAGGFGELMYGSYDETTTVRVTMTMAQLPGTNNYRLSTKVAHVSDAGQAGFEDSTSMMGLWSAEFSPLLKKVAAIAKDAGPY